ncbi:hypothetical protein AAE478_009528 [Parahypoxylon ruwenzoriense]
MPKGLGIPDDWEDVDTDTFSVISFPASSNDYDGDNDSDNMGSLEDNNANTSPQEQYYRPGSAESSNNASSSQQAAENTAPLEPSATSYSPDETSSGQKLPVKNPHIQGNPQSTAPLAKGRFITHMATDNYRATISTERRRSLKVTSSANGRVKTPPNRHITIDDRHRRIEGLLGSLKAQVYTCIQQIEACRKQRAPDKKEQNPWASDIIHNYQHIKSLLECTLKNAEEYWAKTNAGGLSYFHFNQLNPTLLQELSYRLREVYNDIHDKRIDFNKLIEILRDLVEAFYSTLGFPRPKGQ